MKNNTDIRAVTEYNNFLSTVMNRDSLFRQLRVVVLIITVGVLAIDAFFYYYQKAEAEYVPETDVTNLSGELTKPLPSSTSQIESKDNKVESFRILSFNEVEKVDASKIQAAQASFLRSNHPTPISNISVYQLNYDIRSNNGSWQPVAAKIYVPTNEGQYPLFVFGSGTTGIADKCAPSLENISAENLGNYHNHMISQAAEGYVTVFPDYEGFHSPNATQAYFISESEAKTLLGAIQSLIELKPTTSILTVADLQTIFLSGYSQGGHAALSTAQAWEQLPESYKLAGIIEFAGAADVQALFNESPWLASYLVQSYIEYYGSNLQSALVLQNKWLQDLSKNNEALCVNAAYKFYPKSRSDIYNPAFLDAIESDTWPETLQNWHRTIDLNTPLSELPSVPHLSIQGAADPIVTAQTQINNVNTFCEQGHQITYKEYSGINHFDIRKAGFELSNQWMKDVLANKAIPSSCQ